MIVVAAGTQVSMEFVTAPTIGSWPSPDASTSHEGAGLTSLSSSGLDL